LKFAFAFEVRFSFLKLGGPSLWFLKGGAFLASVFCNQIPSVRTGPWRTFHILIPSELKIPNQAQPPQNKIFNPLFSVVPLPHSRD
jgi:hypothetical protein